MEKVPGTGKPGGHHKSRLAGTTRLIKKALQRSQYRKAVEALCSRNKKRVRNCLTCLHQPKHMLPKTPDRVEIRKHPINGFLLIASCEWGITKKLLAAMFLLSRQNLLYKEQ
ncbi:hypothetical protein CRX10_11100 [Salmonella enterica subsp. enterica serovar Newport]|nr:hypothetical protein [Salmonella enterica subsp. enterica serovar Newport]